MDRERQFKQTLKSAGERMTTPRLSIFRIISRHTPIPYRQLMVEATEGGVDKVTAYRTLDLFRRLQVIQELSYGRNKMIELSDDFVAHHHHFWCRECGKLTDFDDSKVEDALRDAVDASGAEIMSHHIEITGVCRECRARR